MEASIYTIHVAHKEWFSFMSNRYFSVFESYLKLQGFWSCVDK
jgi:hypothetical protein